MVLYNLKSCNDSCLEELKRFSELHVGIESRGSPRGFGKQGNIGQISKGTRKQRPIFWEQGNKTLQIRIPKHCKQMRTMGQFWKGTGTPLGDPHSTTAIMPGKCSPYCATRGSRESHEYCELYNLILIQHDF